MRTRRPLSFYFNPRRASAIIGAVVLTGILGMAVASMLSTSRTAISRSADKMAYEEAYQTALAGTHAARAWLIDPDLCKSMHANDSALSSKLADLVDKATVMNQGIAADVEARIKANQALTNMGLFVSEGINRYTNAGLSFEKNTPLADGRYVVYTFTGSPVLTLPTKPYPEKFSASLVNNTKTADTRSYVEWVRLTTPGTSNETLASLRECTFIIESKGVAEYGGKKKERVVQQRILIKPNKPASPLIGATEAIITEQGLSVKGNSSANVHWGPVLAGGDLNLNFIQPIIKNVDKGVTTLEIALNQNQKANIAGLPVAESGNGSNSFDGKLDTRLAWKTGKDGKLMGLTKTGNNEVSLFHNLSGYPTSNFDFFHELGKGTFTNGVDGVPTLKLDSQFSKSNPATTISNPNGLFKKDGGNYTGALVQGSDEVDQRIDEFFGEMNYEKLKTYAQAHNSYYVWDGSKLRDMAGNVVNTPSMSPGNTDPLSAQAAPDRMLFIDSVGGDETKPFKDAFSMPSFWKGVVYVNGPIQFKGNGSGSTVNFRSPEEFEQYRAGNTAIKGTPNTKTFLDGILIANGTANVDHGGGVIYGTLAAKGGVITGANFSIFYNAANGEGRLRDTSKGAQPFSLIAGRLYETAVPKI